MAVEVRDNRESPRVQTYRVLTFVGGFLLVVAIAMSGLYRFYGATLVSGNVRETLSSFPSPQIQPNPTRDLEDFRVRQNQQLAGYAWVDKGRGLVHVPIDRAMAYIVSRGPAALDPPDPTPSASGGIGTGASDGSPRAPASLPASPYGARP